MYTFKGTVKRLEFNAGNGNTYQVSFDYCDKVRVQDTEYGVAYELTDVDLPNLDSLKTNESFIIQDDDKDLFDFLSQHAKEDLEISYENEGSEAKNNKIIKKVVLCYE